MTNSPSPPGSPAWWSGAVAAWAPGAWRWCQGVQAFPRDVDRVPLRSSERGGRKVMPGASSHPGHSSSSSSHSNAWMALVPIYPTVGLPEGPSTSPPTRARGHGHTMPLALAIISFLFVEIWGSRRTSSATCASSSGPAGIQTFVGILELLSPIRVGLLHLPSVRQHAGGRAGAVHDDLPVGLPPVVFYFLSCCGWGCRRRSSWPDCGVLPPRRWRSTGAITTRSTQKRRHTDPVGGEEVGARRRRCGVLNRSRSRRWKQKQRRCSCHGGPGPRLRLSGYIGSAP